jgi:16S rRNA (uracil1498-N3)-methyltransferase
VSALWAYLESLSEVREGEVLVLSSEEARHVQTRRLRMGDPIVLFDGRGHVADGQIESIRKKETLVRTDGPRKEPESTSEFVLATAIPKGDRLSTMLQMLSQLGVVRWRPLVFDDSAMRKLDSDGARLRRILIESCKVARRSWALEISSPIGLDEAIADASGPIFFGDREGEAGGLDPLASLLVIGPEAGLTERERTVLRDAGASPRSLGPHNLRIETAAIAGATAHHLSRAGRPA